MNRCSQFSCNFSTIIAVLNIFCLRNRLGERLQIATRFCAGELNLKTLRTTIVYDPCWKTLWMKVCFFLYDLKLGETPLQDNEDEINEQAETMMVSVYLFCECRDV